MPNRLQLLVVRDAEERAPPQQPPDRRRRLAEPQGHAIEADFLQRLVLVPLHRFLDLGQRLLLGGAEQAHEDTVLAPIAALDREGTVHPGVLIEPRPGEFQVRATQRRIGSAHQGVRLHEDAGPRRPGAVPRPGAGQGAQVHCPADRGRRYTLGEVHQVADETPRSGQRQIAPFGLVHPCTSTNQDVGSPAPHSPGRPARVARPGGRRDWRVEG